MYSTIYKKKRIILLFYYLFCKKYLTYILIFVIVYTERERKNKELAKGQAKGVKDGKN